MIIWRVNFVSRININNDSNMGYLYNNSRDKEE